MLYLFFVILMIVLLISACVSTCCDSIKSHKVCDLSHITCYDSYIYKVFGDYVRRVVADEFYAAGRCVVKQNGDYGVYYMREVNKRLPDYLGLFCNSNGSFNQEFIGFVNHYYTEFRYRDFHKAFSEFLNRGCRFYVESEENHELISDSEFIDECSSDVHNYDQVTVSNNIKDVDIVTSSGGRIVNGVNGMMSVNGFLLKRKIKDGDFVGCYVIYNKTLDKYYVGQAKRLFFRVNQHFTGHGCEDVYSDYLKGHEFFVKLVKLSDGGYDDIDQMEREYIAEFDAYDHGYNKTSGNRK